VREQGQLNNNKGKGGGKKKEGEKFPMGGFLMKGKEKKGKKVTQSSA